MTDERLGPGDLVPPLRRGDGTIPELGSQLQQRLADDGNMPYHDAGAGSLYSANMLDDPLLETVLDDGAVSVGSSWTSIGDAWEARYRSLSGGTPTVTARRTTKRKVMEGGIYRTDVVVFKIEYGAAGASFVEMRPVAPTPPSPHIDWPWVVAAARCYVDSNILTATNLVDYDPEDYGEDEETDLDTANYVRMGLVNDTSWPVDDELDVEGDETDIQELSDDKMESQPYAPLEIDGGGYQWWCLQIHTSTSGAGGVAVGMAEPQINYSYQESPMPFDPVIGNYDPPQIYTAPGVMTPDDCLYEDISGAPFTKTADGYYYQTHDPESGAFESFQAGRNSKVNDLGSSCAVTYWAHTSEPEWSDCGLAGTYARACHQGVYGKYTYNGVPEGTDRIRFQFRAKWVCDWSQGNTFGAWIKHDTFPTEIDDNETFDTHTIPFDPVLWAVNVISFYLPLSYLEGLSIGDTVYIGLKPITRAEEGVYLCSTAWGTHSTHRGANGSWEMEVPDLSNIETYWWSFEPQQKISEAVCPPGEGMVFSEWPVGVGDGKTDTFEGNPTADDTADWFVDGYLTEPASYDDATGIVTFDRPPPPLAEVMQSGAGR